MILRRYTWLAALAIFIAGCARPPMAAPTVAPLAPQPTLMASTAVAQMATQTPTQAAGTAPAMPATGTTVTSPAQALTSYPAPSVATLASGAYPYAGAGQGITPLVTPQGVLPAVVPPPGATPGEVALPASAPFKDCARTPGLVGCSPQGAPLSGMLAFTDPAAKRVVGLNLRTGQGWQALLQPAWLEWAPQGKQLLVAFGGQNYALYTVQGQQAALPPVAAPTTSGFSAEPSWLADGTLTMTGAVQAADGTQAWLEYTPDMTWLLHLKPAQGAAQTLPLEAQPTDRLYQMVGWVPGAQKLLVQRYYASNGAMLVGGEVLLVDIASRAVQTLNVTAPLNTGAGFTWAPVTSGSLAFIASGAQRMGDRRLALLDPKTSQLRYPLPDGINVTGLAWRPDGKRLTFSAAPGEAASAEAKKTFPGAGIYQIDPASGAVETLLASPEGAADGWPHWTVDGQTLLYARIITPANGTPSAQVRARQGATDWTLVDGLPAPEDLFGAGSWRAVIAYGQ